LNREEHAEPKTRTVHSSPPKPWTTTTDSPEEPGDYCFPPIATAITGAAKLMLALLEHAVTERGGTYAFTDTDSMAILATRDGAASGANLHESLAGTRILSYEDVAEIVDGFGAISPYDKEMAPGSVLKIEHPADLDGPQVWCHAISAKRYHLFSYDDNGDIRTVKASYHGLGVYLNPLDPESSNMVGVGDERRQVSHSGGYLRRRDLVHRVRRVELPGDPLRDPNHVTEERPRAHRRRDSPVGSANATTVR
jgi:hypothetical protein